MTVLVPEGCKAPQGYEMHMLCHRRILRGSGAFPKSNTLYDVFMKPV